MTLAEKFTRLKTSVGGNREKMHFEDTFGMPKEEQAHITRPGRANARILAELEFALHLSEAENGKYDAALEEALDYLLEKQQTEGVLTDQACEEAEEILEPIAEEAKSYELILAAHAHIDMNWMWSFNETVSIVLATFRSILNIMDQYPEFCFSQSQASVYKIVEEYDPELMERIKARIAEGRWEVTASAWVETDKNMPSGESLLRHIQYTREYLSKVWGVKDFDLDFSPDTFGHSANVPEIDQFEAEIREILQQKELAIKKADLSMAKELQQRQNEIEEQIQSCKAKEERRNKRKHLTVTENSVADIVSDWTKIPVKKLTDGETKRLAALEKELHKRVIGQDEAVKAVAQAVKRGRVGLKDPHRPIGSFLFLGPTGVGKTELSKALAEAVFGSDQAMIRVDMSEYMEKHSVSKLIGSPPGYVGYDEGGQLSEKVRRNPYSVLLFDEIEKAHPDVFNILLQVLDDGHITDAHGRKVDFKQTIIIMTSNVGAQAIIEPKKLGFMSEKDDKQDYERMKSGVMEEVRRLFKPEFLNRIDEIMVFHPLKKPEIKKIVNILLKNLEKRCEEQLGIELKISESVKDYLAESGFDSKYGARPLRRAIQNRLEDPMANKILDGGIKTGDTVKIQLLKKEIHFVPVREEKETKAKSKKDVKS